jgi:hypothetical protein
LTPDRWLAVDQNELQTKEDFAHGASLAGAGVQFHVWTLPARKGFSFLSANPVGCGHVSGPSMRPELAAGPDEVRGPTSNQGIALCCVWHWPGLVDPGVTGLPSGHARLARRFCMTFCWRKLDSNPQSHSAWRPDGKSQGLQGPCGALRADGGIIIRLRWQSGEQL